MLISQKEKQPGIMCSLVKAYSTTRRCDQEWSDLPFGSRCQVVGISEDRETHWSLTWVRNLKSLSVGNSTDSMPRFFSRQIVGKGKNEEKHVI